MVKLDHQHEQHHKPEMTKSDIKLNFHKKINYHPKYNSDQKRHKIDNELKELEQETAQNDEHTKEDLNNNVNEKKDVKKSQKGHKFFYRMFYPEDEFNSGLENLLHRNEMVEDLFNVNDSKKVPVMDNTLNKIIGIFEQPLETILSNQQNSKSIIESTYFKTADSAKKSQAKRNQKDSIGLDTDDVLGIKREYDQFTDDGLACEDEEDSCYEQDFLSPAKEQALAANKGFTEYSIRKFLIVKTFVDTLQYQDKLTI